MQKYERVYDLGLLKFLKQIIKHLCETFYERVSMNRNNVTIVGLLYYELFCIAVGSSLGPSSLHNFFSFSTEYQYENTILHFSALLPLTHSLFGYNR